MKAGPKAATAEWQLAYRCSPRPATGVGWRRSRGTLATTREPAFRRYRLGQWVGQVDTWLPWGAWAECDDPSRVVADGVRVVLAFDGSASGDSTALVACTDGPDPHVFPVEVWANPGDRGWRVPRGDVDAAVAAAFDRWDVAELACDPWGWRSEIETWAARHGEKRVLEWNTAHASRMARPRIGSTRP